MDLPIAERSVRNSSVSFYCLLSAMLQVGTGIFAAVNVLTNTAAAQNTLQPSPYPLRIS